MGTFRGETPSTFAGGTEALSESVMKFVSDAKGRVCPHGRRWVALAFAADRYP